VNWNIWLAFFTLYHDIRGRIKYRIQTFAPVKLDKLTIANGDISKASPYEAVNYYMLEKLFKAFRDLSPVTSIIDLGCGKGRVITVAAYFGFLQITGIDFAKELCEEASANMKKHEPLFPALSWNIINANVLDYAIKPDDFVFFMFNPFSEEILNGFLDKLENSCKAFPRKTYFIYASPIHIKTLEAREYKIVFEESVLNLKGSILKHEPYISHNA
jgi:SAM-dependent methyltransferase